MQSRQDTVEEEEEEVRRLVDAGKQVGHLKLLQLNSKWTLVISNDFSLDMCVV